MQSVWQVDTALPKFPKLKKDIRTDVLIIGGGMAGLLTAYFLHQSGVQYMLVEKGRICSGITQHTTAKLTAQHGLIYQKLFKSGGFEAAQCYWQANQTALDAYAKLCRNIDCDYEIKDNYVYSLDDRQKLEREADVLHRIGCSASICDQLSLPMKTAGAVKVPDQAQFHPLKFAAVIARGLHIYEHTFVREMIGNTAVTDSGHIHAKQVIVTTHFPFLNKHGSYFLKLYQHRSYVIALENAADVNGMYVDEQQTGMSFRNYQNLLFLGGGGHRTGKAGGDWEILRSFAKQHYPNAHERYSWAAQDCMSLDGIPYIGQYSKQTPNFFVASGFNKWGMTGAMVSAMLLHDRIMGNHNDYASLFNPSRSILKPQLFVNGAEAIKSLLKPTAKRCPHLGCALKWNPAEHTWDCPCHGSRFSDDGTVLDNPANGNLSLNTNKKGISV